MCYRLTILFIIFREFVNRKLLEGIPNTCTAAQSNIYSDNIIKFHGLERSEVGGIVSNKREQCLIARTVSVFQFVSRFARGVDLGRPARVVWKREGKLGYCRETFPGGSDKLVTRQDNIQECDTNN